MQTASLKEQFINVITYNCERDLWFTRPYLSFEEAMESLLDDLVMVTELYKKGESFKMYEWDEEESLSDNSDIHHRVGRKIRDLQDAKGWSLKTLAKKTRLHPEYLQGLQRGESIIGLCALKNIADALDVHSSELLPY